ncbi:Uncharacterised protein [uncultured archaeon]|nr:Uncharacterised protein [uncultured archaeon]
MATEETKEQTTQQKEMRGYRSPQYREITPTAFFGGIRQGYIEATLITSKISAIEKMFKGNDVVEYTEEITLNLTPLQAKMLTAWLLKYLKYYEDIFMKTNAEEGSENKEQPSLKEVSPAKLDEILKEL